MAKVLGTVLGLTARIVTTVFLSPLIGGLQFIIGLIRLAVSGFQAMAGGARSVARFFGFGGSQTGPELLGRTAEPTPGGLPLRGPTTAESTGRDVSQLAGIASTRRERGESAGPGGLLATLNVKTQVDLDGRRLAEGTTVAQERLRKSRGGVSDAASSASGFGDRFLLGGAF